MKITDELLDYIGILARLHISEEEREKTKQEINKIVEYMDILNELDTTGIEAEYFILNAANKKEGCFKVPKAVE